MARAVIGLGSNLGDGRENLLAAWKKLEAKGGRSIALSSPFLTEPVGMESSFLFTNAVGILETMLPPRQLLAVMFAVEAEFGRDRSKGKDRMVDLDLLFYDDLVLNTAELVLPHPHIAARRFVLAPLAEVAPDFVHPLLGRTTAAMLRELDDAGGVTPMEWQRK